MNSHCLKWGIHFDLANKRDRVEELDKTMEDPGFWDDPEHSAKIVQESKKLKSVIERYESLESARDDILMLIEIAEEENDVSVLEEVEDSLQQFEQEYESLRIETLLSGEYDKDNAILTLHAGAGGTESCDWASMLCRMYQRFAEKHGFEVEMLDFLDGDEAMLLTPPKIFSLEEALEWINDDELVEVTPDAIRIRKKGLTALDRRNLYRQKMNAQ